jgi:hypothetical protein
MLMVEPFLNDAGHHAGRVAAQGRVEGRNETGDPRPRARGWPHDDALIVDAWALRL